MPEIKQAGHEAMEERAKRSAGTGWASIPTLLMTPAEP